MTKKINLDFINFVFDLKEMGYTYSQIKEKVMIKFSLKNCSEKTIQRAVLKKRKKTGQNGDNIRTVSGQ